MFEVKIVKSCPVSRGTRGIVMMDRSVVGEIAGAMESQKGIEWAVLLLGKREQDGRRIRVTGLSVPKQSRSAGDVQLPEMELGEEVVGVLHSHHSMGAFFSQTDNTELNPRFGFSIVVAETDRIHENKNRAGEQAIVLGWDYLAEARVMLPCGKMGVIGMDVMTDEATSREVGWLIDVWNSSGCESERELGDMFVEASCGLVNSRLKERTFGQGTGLIEKGLRENTIEPVKRPDMGGVCWAGWKDEHLVKWSGEYRESRKRLLWGEGDLVEMVDNQIAGTVEEDEEGYWFFNGLYEEWLDDVMGREVEDGNYFQWLYQWVRSREDMKEGEE